MFQSVTYIHIRMSVLTSLAVADYRVHCDHCGPHRKLCFGTVVHSDTRARLGTHISQKDHWNKTAITR